MESATGQNVLGERQISQLPAELIRMIGSYLSPEKLFVFRAGCQRLKRLCPEQHILREIRRKHYLRVSSSRHGDKLYMLAIKNGEIGILKLLVSRGYRFDKNVVMTCVRSAPPNKLLPICRYLISLGYLPTGLRWAVYKTRWYDVVSNDAMELIKLLTNKDEFTDATIRDCLSATIYTGYGSRFTVLKHLLSIGTETSASLAGEMIVTKSGPFLRFLCYSGRRIGTSMGKKLCELIYPYPRIPSYTGDLATDLLRGVSLLG